MDLNNVAFHIALNILLHCINLATTVPWHAIKDAEIPPSGTPQVKEVPETPYVILRKRVTYQEGKKFCETMFYRLATLPKLEDAKQLVQKIAISSQKFTPEYWTVHKKYEYGMDRRYWIGLTDSETEGTWIWNKSEGLQLDFDFWYPGQPDHDHGRPEHCVSLWNPGFYHGDQHKFNDEECINKHYAICEKQPPKAAIGRKPSRYGQTGRMLEDEQEDTHSTSEKTTSENTTSENTTPENTTSENTTPENTTSEKTTM